MMSTSSSVHTNKGYREFPCALDNGAFGCWRRGFPFMSDNFRKQISAAHKSGVTLDFITCPDIVAGGERSLQFSMDWATGELRSAPRLALVVQDGMGEHMVSYQHPEQWFSHIFVGGTKAWKWRTAEAWVKYAHGKGMKCHIGQCGRLEYLREAKRIGADSVDSTSFAVNDSWHIVEEFYQGPSLGLF